MAQYLVLIYEDEASWESAGTETFERVLVKHRRFGEDNVAALRGGNALQPTSMATSLRKDAAGGLTVNRRGVRETTEALGGYYLIEAGDLDQALAVAKQVPAPFGGVEV